jgi:hypothetical protein
MTSPAPISVENLVVLNLSYSHNMLWKAEIDGSNETLQAGQTKADLRVPSLTHFSCRYFQSEELQTNQAALIALLRPGDRWHIDQHWRPKENEVIYHFTKRYVNLGINGELSWCAKVQSRT